MKIFIKNKEYTAGKLVMQHAIEVMEMEKKGKANQIDEIGQMDVMVDILAQSLINGQEKIPYDEIKPEKLNEYKKLIKYNVPLSDLNPIYAKLLEEMNGKYEGDEEGK